MSVREQRDAFERTITFLRTHVLDEPPAERSSG